MCPADKKGKEGGPSDGRKHALRTGGTTPQRLPKLAVLNRFTFEREEVAALLRVGGSSETVAKGEKAPFSGGSKIFSPGKKRADTVSSHIRSGNPTKEEGFSPPNKLRNLFF